MNSEKWFLARLLLITILIFFSVLISRSALNPAIAAEKISEGCPKLVGDFEDCYKKEFSRYLKEQDLSFGIQTLKELQKFNPALNHCHVLSHHIGRTAAIQKPEDWLDYFNQVGFNDCGGGYLHGII